MPTLTIRTIDNKDYYIIYNIDKGVLDVEFVEIKFDNIVEDINNLGTYFEIIVKDSTLYHVRFSRDDAGYKLYYKKIMDNVKDVMFDNLVLTNDNILYVVGDYNSHDEYFLDFKGIAHIPYYEKDKIYKVMENVKDISYIENKVLIMEDNTVWMYGENKDNKFNDSVIVRSDIPVLVKGLPNALDVIPVYDIDLITLGEKDFTVGKSYDYYMNVFPYNAANKEVVWDSSNKEVATISNDGKITAVSPCKSVISVETADGKIREEVEITVCPDVSGVEIINGDNVDLSLHETLILEAKVSPGNTLENELVWSVSGGDGINFSDYKFHPEFGSVKFPDNKREIYVRKGGTYTVTVTTKNGLYSDTVTINTVEKVSYIELDIDDGHFDGSYNAFIYLNESNKLNVGYKVMPDSATNKEVTWNSSNPDVAEVSNDGVITGKKVGMTNITIESVDGNAIRSFNLLVYDSNKNGVLGDVTGDGKVDIKDVIRLRRYLAGLEELE